MVEGPTTVRVELPDADAPATEPVKTLLRVQQAPQTRQVHLNRSSRKLGVTRRAADGFGSLVPTKAR